MLPKAAAFDTCLTASLSVGVVVPESGGGGAVGGVSPFVGGVSHWKSENNAVMKKSVIVSLYIYIYISVHCVSLTNPALNT